MFACQDRERGTVLVTVAITLIVLVGFTALAIDGGLAYNERRSTQNAADNATLAATWAKCNGASDAEAEQAAIESAIANGYDGTVANTNVEITKLFSATGERYHVRITQTGDTSFGNAIGSPQVTVVSEAEAECKDIPWAGGYAIFAGAPPECGGIELDFTGTTKTVNGGVHSNGDLQIQGANTVINGPVTYSGDVNVGSGTYPPGYPAYIAPQSYPFGFTLADVLAANATHVINANGATIDNNWLRNNPPSGTKYGSGTGGFVTLNVSGVYYTTGSIDLNNLTVAPGVSVTFLAEGPIHVRGSGNMTRFDETYDMLMMSNYPGDFTCTTDVAIQWSASNGVWDGLIYAPYGQARQNNASSFSVNGSIVAYTVSLNGASFDINWRDNPLAPPQWRMEILK